MARLASLLVSFSLLLLTATGKGDSSTSPSPPTVTVPFKDGVNVSFEGAESTGRDGEDVDAFFGIPFGNEPERWKAPVMKQWNETEALMTSTTGDLMVNVSDPEFLGCLQLEGQSGVMGERDCLKLNVWKPSNATPSSNLPVMVFILGGGGSKTVIFRRRATMESCTRVKISSRIPLW